MVRKKSLALQSRRAASAAVAGESTTTSDVIENGADSVAHNGLNDRELKTIFVDVNKSSSSCDEHRDIAEVILNDVRFNDELVDYKILEDTYIESNYCLRFRLCDIEGNSIRLGQWPVVPSESIFLEYLIPQDQEAGGNQNRSVLFSGKFDCQGEGISGLVHLIKLDLFSIRLDINFEGLAHLPTFRCRVEILNKTFDMCTSLLDNVRHPRRKSLICVMSWLRPELTTSEAIYGAQGPLKDAMQSSGPKGEPQFDLFSFYEAIKPSRNDQVWNENLPGLLPHLRPYQLRAVNWMVQCERGILPASANNAENKIATPYCIPVGFLDSDCRMYYNPFSGSVTLHLQEDMARVPGGILADEMGLGKTVELLACIVANRKPLSDNGLFSESEGVDKASPTTRQKIERVECICGAASESSKYEGLWVQCDICDAWQHAECVGYSPTEELNFDESDSGEELAVGYKMSKRRTKKRRKRLIVQTKEKYICTLCAELMEARKYEINSHGTLVVCPGPILLQWHSEILRHTRSGILKVCIYEGAKNLGSCHSKMFNELVNADIVLTTYDVLREDLSHDSDRHYGDRHFLRFQKKYPVTPTVLTKIYWWRLCLDEAQMVESNCGSATEMAMRLNAQHRWCITGTPIQRRLDDLYGLLRFLRASPFDVYRWWVDIIKDPYERGDKAAMGFAHSYFKQIMWRSSKMLVMDELELPPQEECISWLAFTPVENHFYQKQHATCVDRVQRIISTLKGSDAPSDIFLSQEDFAKLGGPLLKLRQACCHPQVGGSGICSLQNSPLSMEEILEVLINKTKIEGEDELRKFVVALNGLAGIAAIEQDYNRSISLYQEALSLTDENQDYFRLDPLLNLHINHNLAEMRRSSSNFQQECTLTCAHSEDSNSKKRELASCGAGEFELDHAKRQKISNDVKSSGIADSELSENSEKTVGDIHDGEALSGASQLLTNDVGNTLENNSKQPSSLCFADSCLRRTCDKIVEKYLLLFTSKVSVAQQEFNASYEQVCSMTKELQNRGMSWWLFAVDSAEKNDSREELLKKIDSSISQRTNSTQISLKVKNISNLKYTIQTGLDALQSARKTLIDRLLEVDRTMQSPSDEDIELQRYCPNCFDGNGSLCIQCELDEIFQVYEARLFLVKKTHSDNVIASVEEAQDFQKRKNQLNHFFRNKQSTDEDESAGGENQRTGRQNVQVYRHHSTLETMLRAINSHAKKLPNWQDDGTAKKHLLLFELMRKEFTQARLLSIALTQLLRAHDEIKMSTSRLKLRESEDEPLAVNVLHREELIASSLQFSSEKFASLISLSRLRGQLNYLKGLAMANKCAANSCSLTSIETSTNINDESCPVCQEKGFTEKMVFQCGHFTCFKCCLAMIERAPMPQRLGLSRKWILCPTCRQRTNVDSIAYVAAKPTDNSDLETANALENSMAVEGSYGTKVGAITRRILWIVSSDESARILVFSSWNDVLDVLAHALTANNVLYIRMKGARKSHVALARFKGQQLGAESKPIQVLLMLIQHGANGLNLLEAQHVILVEPLLNPAAEAQAISRVHRIGQEKRTYVHRFYVKDTIEESIYKLNKGKSVGSTLKRTARKFKDEPMLTLKDIETLFLTVPPGEPSEPQQGDDDSTTRLRHLPPATAAGIAAERRLAAAASSSHQ